MHLEDYQKKASKTAIYPEASRVVYPILGLLGEAGELANKYKKVIRDNDGRLTDEKRKELFSELGDVLWYCAAIATDLNLSLSDVANENIAKLKSRQERGKLNGSGDNR
jgi:NTP pyrophosphatase (non-canonical NTP hydrolase)